MEVTSAIWDIIRNLHRVARVQRRAAAGSPLGAVALGVLNLAAQSPIRPSAAAAELDVTAQAVTRATAELTDRGLVRRVGDTADGRSYVIELTAEGHTARATWRRELTASLARHLDGWSAEEIVGFARQLSDLTASLIAEPTASAPPRPTRNPWNPPS
jgi:DNA-binding MarR family transcriptional regulator